MIFKETRSDDIKTIKEALEYAIMYAKTEAESVKFALVRVDLESIEPKQYVNAKFGIDWPDYAMENLSKKDIAEMCAAQGRKAIMLENNLSEFLNR